MAKTIISKNEFTLKLFVFFVNFILLQIHVSKPTILSHYDGHCTSFLLIAKLCPKSKNKMDSDNVVVWKLFFYLYLKYGTTVISTKHIEE